MRSTLYACSVGLLFSCSISPARAESPGTGHQTAYLDAGVLQVRTSAYLRWNNTCGDVLDEWWAAYQPIHDPKRQLRRPGLKIFTDGGVCNDAALTFPTPTGPSGTTAGRLSAWSTT